MGLKLRQGGAQTACRWGWDADFCIWATAAQLNALVKYVTNKNADVSGDVSRLTFAKVICQLTGRDTSPDTTGYSGNIQYFPDVTSSVDLVTEVSHEHDYILDVDGNEYWI